MVRLRKIMNSNTKLYMISRKDLPPGAQACQVVHVICELAHRWTYSFLEWKLTSNTIVFLSVNNEDELKKMIFEAHKKDIQVECFYEPDLDNALTAIALVPDDNPDISELCKDLPLALEEYGMSYRF